MVVVCSGKGEGERHECRTACFYLMDSDAMKGLYSADLKEVLDIRHGPGGGGRGNVPDGFGIGRQLQVEIQDSRFEVER